jgi:GDP-4-dehydro-6-deoxy-D-mannose reductase
VSPHQSRQRLLVTGATGFVGKHVDAAVQAGVFGEMEFVPAPANLDIRDEDAVAAMVAALRPDAVLHLAAQSFVPRSFETPRETFDINMVYVSSGDVYGQVPESALPVTEALPPQPRSPYAVSKIAAEQLCLQWQRTEGLDVMIARPFNHVGPGQDRRFVLPGLAAQVVAIADGRSPAVIEAGDIDTTRDFTDVRDVVAAYAAMIQRGVTGAIYLVGSGSELRVRDLLAAMCALEGIDPALHQDPAKMRPSEQRRMAADASRLRADTGWVPAIRLEVTLADIIRSVREYT